MSETVKTTDGHQGELLCIKGNTAFIKENNGKVWYCPKTDIIENYDKKDYQIRNLQSQLDQANERLKGAINKPKFEHFEICFYIENNPYCNNELQIFRGEILEINVAFDEDYLYEYRFDTSCRYIEENMIFATLEEAEKKLQELRGGDFQGE